MSTNFAAGERQTDSPAEEHAVQPYDIALKEIPIPVKDGNKHFDIVLSKPTRAQNERRERLQKTIKRTAAKVEDQDAVTITQDTARATDLFTRAIAKKVKGYKFEVDPSVTLPIDADGWVDAQFVIVPDADEETAKRFGVERDKDRKYNIRVIDVIPARHRLLAGNALYGGRFDVERPNAEVISLRAQRLGSVTQKMGIVSLENGELSKPTNVLTWRLRDPESGAVGKFDTHAITGTTIFLKGGGTEEHRIVSLDTCVDLFDSHIESADGVVVNGEEFDAKNPEHLKEVDDGLKKSIVLIYFNGIQVESGN